MKVIRIESLYGTEREVKCPRGGFTSYRALLEKDGMGFTVTRTVIPVGNCQHWHYKNHLEACYCISGLAVICDKAGGEMHRIDPGAMYVLNNHDAHSFLAIEETVLLCVFNPPLVGKEVHDKTGSYKDGGSK